jgi:hypothetical protein
LVTNTYITIPLIIMTKEKYKITIDKLIKKHGRKRIWVSDKMGIPRTTFWQMVNQDTFTSEQKQRIEKIIVHGV